MVNINKKNCKVDTDCDNNICAFDELSLNHYCINNDMNELYYGCLNINEANKVDSIDSNSELEHNNYKNCIDFSRRQINSDGLEYNYMVYKPKKKLYVDTTNINIYLKCNNEILAVIPYEDYFHLKCNTTQENCTLESKEHLLNFIKQNTKNCSKNIYLEVIYECENEGIKKKELMTINLDNNDPIKINLKCPIELNNNKNKSKCSALYLNKSKTNNNIEKLIDTSISLNNCNNPIYTVPRIVQNVNKYKKIKTKESNIEIQEYDKEINNKVKELKKLKANKYIKLKKIQDGELITEEDAYDIIDKISLDKLLNNSKENWKFYNNFDAAQNLYDDVNYSSSLKYHGLVYTIDDAVKIANENNENFFVWYHNSYELDNFASKLYFIDINEIEDDKLMKSNWSSHENVTTALFKFELENFDVLEERDNIIDDDIDEINRNILLLDTLKEREKIINDKYIASLSNQDKKVENDGNLILNVLGILDDKITKQGQSVSMNNYENNINNTILIILSLILSFICVMFVVVLVYFNNLTAGKIKIFGQ